MKVWALMTDDGIPLDANLINIYSDKAKAEKGKQMSLEENPECEFWIVEWEVE